MDENRIFLRTIEEKYERFVDYYSMMNSDFLSLEQQSLLAGFLRSRGREGVVLFGGFGDAERKQVYFMPDYTGVTSEQNILSWFEANPEDCPLALLEVTVPAASRGKLTHRDYLGALMGEGIKREKIGDIIVTDTGAQIVATREMAAYLEQNYRHVGRVEVTAKVTSIFDVKAVKSQINPLHFTVSSTRLDNIIAGTYNLSRKLATEAILGGRVYVNGVELTKPDWNLKGGEKIVLRGKGKAIYCGTEGTSKKGKLYVRIDKYV